MTAPSLAAYDRRKAGLGTTASRIGTGPIGGKATGLELLRSEVLRRIDRTRFDGFDLTVPAMVVVAADVFDTFVAENRLQAGAQSDDRIALAFQRAEVPAEFAGDLRAVASGHREPLAVRSSSVLEDALRHPLAGLYTTKMIPGSTTDEAARYRRLEQALKLVWASTYFAAARSGRAAAGLGDDRMAVVLQEVVGTTRRNRFYPTLSAVAKSLDVYATGDTRPEDGIVHLALGLGKTIVDGGASWRFCPQRPTAPPPFNDVGDLLKSTQRSFWAVHIGEPPPPDPIRETEHLVEVDLAEAETDGVLSRLVSTYEPSSDRLVSGLSGRGPRALTFAPLLGSRFIPFAELFEAILAAAKEASGCDVEVELALSLEPRHVLPATVALLQVRPLAVASGSTEVDDEQMADSRAVVAVHMALGDGRRDDVADVVWVPPERFEPETTRAAAADLARLNTRLVDQGRPYLLIGFGRWGTSDDRLGVPVTWGQISGAKVIVEATLPEVDPDLSQGSHFFHNILGSDVLYLSARWNGPDRVDWEWLAAQPVAEDTGHVVHSVLPQPVTVRVDGRRRRGVVTAP